MSNIYNLVNGVNPATFFILPMLGNHPDWYPRYRDCWVTDDENSIAVLTRVGSSNKGFGCGEEKMYNHPEYIKDEDFPEDPTYGIYYFRIPEKWKSDFDILLRKKSGKVSKEYIEECKRVFPKISDKIKNYLENLEP